MKQFLTIAHMYPEQMNIYGDRGNVLALVKRLEWRGFGAEVIKIGLNSQNDLQKCDVIFAGGGQDSGQITVSADLQHQAAKLHQAADNGVVMLAVCGTYQLFGRGFKTIEGHQLPGIGIFKAETVGSTLRMIGNIVVDSQWGRLVGFENHSGQTVLDSGQDSLGRVLKGFGNNSSDGYEGAMYNNVYGTYLHGSLLPKNPHFADHLILTALKRKYGIENLEPLDDELENKAAAIAMKRLQ
jgi:lipid II isoglutaminyl synthase (glutamine-hydrolysing)